MAVYRHSELDTYYVGPDSARAMLAQGGWERLNDKDAAAYLDAQRDAELGVEDDLASTVVIDPSLATPETDGGDNEKENG